MSSDADAWALIAAGGYAEAVEALTASIRSAPSSLAYNNRGTAWVLLGDLDRALGDYAAAGQLDVAAGTPSDNSLKCGGMVLWLMGRRAEAARLWQRAVDELARKRVDYSDGAGGVEAGCLLWFAATMLSDDTLRSEARGWLEKLGRGRRADWWPGPLGLHLLGRLELAELRAQLPPEGVLRVRRACQAEFYAGVRASSEGDPERAREHFRQAASSREALVEIEYHLAVKGV